MAWLMGDSCQNHGSTEKIVSQVFIIFMEWMTSIP
jgi:hypothetical protein